MYWKRTDGKDARCKVCGLRITKLYQLSGDKSAEVCSLKCLTAYLREHKHEIFVLWPAVYAREGRDKVVQA